MKTKVVHIRISGSLLVPEEATDEEIYEAVRFSVGMNGHMDADNPVGEDLEWIDDDGVVIY